MIVCQFELKSRSFRSKLSKMFLLACYLRKLFQSENVFQYLFNNPEKERSYAAGKPIGPHGQKQWRLAENF